jgi:hypothetical protein
MPVAVMPAAEMNAGGCVVARGGRGRGGMPLAVVVFVALALVARCHR